MNSLALTPPALSSDLFFRVIQISGDSASDHHPLVAPRAPQRERFELRQLTVWPHHVVVDDLDAGKPAALRARINGEGREAVGVCGVPYRRPRCVLLNVDWRPLPRGWIR